MQSLKKNIWLLDYSDDLTSELNSVFGTEFGKKYIALQDIKRSVAQSKIVNKCNIAMRNEPCISTGFGKNQNPTSLDFTGI